MSCEPKCRVDSCTKPQRSYGASFCEAHSDEWCRSHEAGRWERICVEEPMNTDEIAVRQNNRMRVCLADFAHRVGAEERNGTAPLVPLHEDDWRTGP